MYQGRQFALTEYRSAHLFQKVILLIPSLLLVLMAGCNDSPDNRPDNKVTELMTPPSDCFWQIEVTPTLNEETNKVWPDVNTAYWGAVYQLPEGGSHITIEGKFPHSRYISYSNYYALGGTISDLTDIEIQPALGSTNPFVPGNPRNDPSRVYSLTIRKGTPEIAPTEDKNILYGADELSLLMYRVYLPDAGTDALGDGGRPRITLHMEDGSIVQGIEACDAVNYVINSEDRKVEWYTEDEYASYRESSDPSQNPPKFRATYNFEFHKQCDFSGDCSRIPAIPLRYVFPDPHHLYSFINQQHGEVLMLRGRLPETPKTYNGDDFVTGNTELRYWSICSYEYFSQRGEACLFDEQIQVNDDGFYTIVISREDEKPTNASNDCGVSHLSWSPNGDGFGIVDGRENNTGDGFLDIRNILPSETFDQVAPSPDTLGEEDSMGEYLPKGRYFGKAEFEGLGCNPWLTQSYDSL